jgi:metal-sulfur cluster biosynthetic enzyme
MPEHPMTEAALRNALRDCFDPETRRDIVSLGLLRAATLTLDADAPGAHVPGNAPRYIARIALTAPGMNEAANEQLKAVISNRLAGIMALSRSEITLHAPLLPILR